MAFSAMAQLDAGSVRNLLGNQVADGDADLVKLRSGERRQLEGVFHQAVDLADVELGSADRAGRIFIDFDINMLRLVDHGGGIGTDSAEAEEAVLVHGGDGDTERVVVVVGTDVARTVAVIVRHIIRETGRKSLPGTAAGKPGFSHDLSEEVVIGIERVWVCIKEHLDTDAGESAVLCSPADGVDDGGRLGNGGIHADQPAVFHTGGNFIGSEFFLFIKRFIVCHSLSSIRLRCCNGLFLLFYTQIGKITRCRREKFCFRRMKTETEKQTDREEKSLLLSKGSQLRKTKSKPNESTSICAFFFKKPNSKPSEADSSLRGRRTPSVEVFPESGNT